MTPSAPSSLPAISAALASRSEELARGWIEAMEASLGAQPRRVFPSEDLLDHMPSVVRWVVRAPGEAVALPVEVTAALQRLVRLRREQHALLEELLMELGQLEDLLFDTLQEEVMAREASSADALTMARSMAARVTGLLTVVAGIHGELAEDVRRGERRKLDDFTRMVSHEMRTPIGAAFTAARALEDMGEGLPPEERERLLAVVGRGLTRATHLLESVMSLTLARGEPRETASRSLRAVVADIVTSYHEQAEGAGVRLEVPTSVPAAEVDARRVELVLSNLVTNAIKYADAEKSDRWVHVRVERERDGAGWRVQVADNGVGIPREEQEKIFRRFYRAHADLARGTGLGLVIAREAVEQLGSELRVESVPGVGSTFYFAVPDLAGQAF